MITIYIDNLNKEDLKSDEYIYRLIKLKIAYKELFPNTQIVESKLSEETGISRTPIREAIKRLNYEGIVDIVPNKGAFITAPTPKAIRDTYECKMLLEGEAIKLACDNITDNEIRDLEVLIDKKLNLHITKDFTSFLYFNKEFHMIIANASQNESYIKYIQELINKTDIFLLFYDKFMTTTTENSLALKEHSIIIEALKSKDKEKCKETIIRHNKITVEELSLKGII